MSSSRDSINRKLSRAGTPTPLLQIKKYSDGIECGQNQVDANFSFVKKSTTNSKNDSSLLVAADIENENNSNEANLLAKNSIEKNVNLLNDLNASVVSVSNNNGLYEKINEQNRNISLNEPNVSSYSEDYSNAPNLLIENSIERDAILKGFYILNLFSKYNDRGQTFSLH